MSIPIWQHIIVVLTLLGTNALTFFIGKRRIEALQAGLLAKNVLLQGRDETATIVAGGTMVLTVQSFVTRIRIWSKHHAQLQIDFEDNR